MNVNNVSIKNRDTGFDFIRFFAMILIIVSHFISTGSELSYNVPLWFKDIFCRSSIQCGRVGVALFFILSGSVLLISKNYTLRQFYKKRLLRISVPQWIGFILAVLATYIVNDRVLKLNVLGIVISFLGLNYYGEPWNSLGISTLWVVGEWFTTVIILLYLLFPFLKKLLDSHRLLATIVITIIFALNLKFKILSSNSGAFSITNGLMYFWLGMLFYEYKHLFNKYILSLNFIIVLLLYILAPKDILGINYLPSFIFSVALYPLLYKIKISNVFTKYICKYNYEIYLVHHRIYILFAPALLSLSSSNVQSIIAFIVLTGIVFLVSEFLQKVSNKVLEKIG